MVQCLHMNTCTDCDGRLNEGVDETTTPVRPNVSDKGSLDIYISETKKVFTVC